VHDLTVVCSFTNNQLVAIKKQKVRFCLNCPSAACVLYLSVQVPLIISVLYKYWHAITSTICLLYFPGEKNTDRIKLVPLAGTTAHPERRGSQTGR
jgi:hypothetical protein